MWKMIQHIHIILEGRKDYICECCGKLFSQWNFQKSSIQNARFGIISLPQLITALEKN